MMIFLFRVKIDARVDVPLHELGGFGCAIRVTIFGPFCVLLILDQIAHAVFVEV